MDKKTKILLARLSKKGYAFESWTLFEGITENGGDLMVIENGDGTNTSFKVSKDLKLCRPYTYTA